MKIFVVSLLLIILSGCMETYQWKSDPEIASTENDLYYISLKPIAADTYNPGFKAFTLAIKNKTEKNLELVWDKTLFIKQGQTSGGFLFEGIVYKDRNNPKPPDIIFANQLWEKKILPNNLVYFSSGRYGGWEHEQMPAGENGAYITIKTGDKEYNEKLVMNIYQYIVNKNR